MYNVRPTELFFYSWSATLSYNSFISIDMLFTWNQNLIIFVDICIYKIFTLIIFYCAKTSWLYDTPSRSEKVNLSHTFIVKTKCYKTLMNKRLIYIHLLIAYLWSLFHRLFCKKLHLIFAVWNNSNTIAVTSQ